MDGALSNSETRVGDLYPEKGTVNYPRINLFGNGATGLGLRMTGNRKIAKGRLGDIWYLDEVFIKIRGELYYLWRAVDQDGDTV